MDGYIFVKAMLSILSIVLHNPVFIIRSNLEGAGVYKDITPLARILMVFLPGKKRKEERK
jgi:hypothetical protein